MPQLFFTWVQRADKRVHFEFLDNSVSFGQRPRTAAFGWNDTLNVLDVKCLLDIDRYRRVKIDATSPEALYRDRSQLAPEQNVEFLRQCVAQLIRLVVTIVCTEHSPRRLEVHRGRTPLATITDRRGFLGCRGCRQK